MAKIISSLFFFLFLYNISFTQTVNHWESVIRAENTWSYRIGNTEPPNNWNTHGYNDDLWGQGPGGFGYGDEDDNTTIAKTASVYLRKEFDIVDLSTIEKIILYADYDDAFVAYLNGVEIARANIGITGDRPHFDALATMNHEAQLYQGGLPEPFSFVPEDLQDIWNNGTNTLAIQVHNVVANSSDMSSTFFLIVGINDNSQNYQALPQWFIEPFQSSNLPLFIVNTSGTPIPDEPKINAHLGVIDNGTGQRNYLTDEYNAYDGKIGIEIKGASSQSFAKKNYLFETRKENGDNNNITLLGLPKENDWVLHGPFADKSLMRNVLSYHIGSQTDNYTPRTRWCELIINNDYRGVYMLTEKIKRDKNRVNISKLKPEDISGDELTGGYLFKIDRDAQGVDDGWYSAYTKNVFYAYADPNYKELFRVQKDYLKDYISEFEDAMDGANMEEVYEEYIDVPSFVDYLLATEIFKQIDGYKLSFFMYKKKDSNGGKIHFGPLWDLNLAYGNYDFGRDPGPEDWSYLWANSGTNRPFWIPKLMELDTIQNRVNCRWQELRQQAWHTDSLVQFLDQNANLIEEARIRNFERWRILDKYVWPNDFVGKDYQEEFDFLKNWLIERLEWMDENMEGTCAIVANEAIKKQDIALKVFPNPFQEKLKFQLENSFSKKAKLYLFDVLGKNIAQFDLTNNQIQSFSFPNSSSGIYFYKLEIDNTIVTFGKLVKN